MKTIIKQDIVDALRNIGLECGDGSWASPLRTMNSLTI